MTVVVVVVLLAVALAGAFLASGPATERTRMRAAVRRARFVEAHPQHVTSSDILARLRRDGVDVEQARFIVAHAARLTIRPFTMWLWLEQFDAEALGVVVAADLTTAELLSHICHGTVPHLEELKVFAACNGLEIAGPVVARRGPAPRVGRTRLTRSPLPLVHEPGTWPEGPGCSGSPTNRETDDPASTSGSQGVAGGRPGGLAA